MAGPQPPDGLPERRIVTKLTPAVRKPSADADLARAAAIRIRNEIQNAVYSDELDAKGVNGASATEDERIIRAQPGGHKVWQDLVGRDTSKRKQMTSENETEDVLQK